MYSSESQYIFKYDVCIHYVYFDQTSNLKNKTSIILPHQCITLTPEEFHEFSYIQKCDHHSRSSLLSLTSKT